MFQQRAEETFSGLLLATVEAPVHPEHRFKEEPRLGGSKEENASLFETDGTSSSLFCCGSSTAKTDQYPL